MQWCGSVNYSVSFDATAEQENKRKHHGQSYPGCDYLHKPNSSRYEHSYKNCDPNIPSAISEHKHLKSLKDINASPATPNTHGVAGATSREKGVLPDRVLADTEGRRSICRHNPWFHRLDEILTVVRTACG